MTIKSPFLILKDLFSPAECEDFLFVYDLGFHNKNIDGNPIKSTLYSTLHQHRIWQRLEEYLEDIQNYYDVDIDYLSEVEFEWYPEKCVNEGIRCENSRYDDGKWSIVNRNDFTIIIFLKDHCETSDIDPEYECRGGKLEFSNHQFSFIPERGTGIVFPSNHYFLNSTTQSTLGDVCQIRLHFTCDTLFQYEPRNYEGNYTTWFSNIEAARTP